MGEDRATETTELRLLITVRDRLHLADVLRTIRRSSGGAAGVARQAMNGSG